MNHKKKKNSETIETFYQTILNWYRRQIFVLFKSFFSYKNTKYTDIIISITYYTLILMVINKYIENIKKNHFRINLRSVGE